MRVLRSYIEAFSGLPRDAWILTAAVLVNRAGTMVVPFLTLWLTIERGYSVDTAGLLLGAFGVGSIVGSWLGGQLADRIGANTTQGLSLLASAAGFLVLGQMDGLAAIAVVIFFLSVVSEAFRPAHISAVAALVEPEERARAIGLSRLGINVGMSIGPAVGGFLAEANYALLFWVDGVTSAVAGIGLLVLFRGRERARAREEQALASGPTPSPLSDRAFLAMAGVVALVGLAFFQCFTTVPLYFSEHLGFGESTIGLVFTLNTVLIVIFEMPLLRRVEGRPPLRLIAIGGVLVCAGNALLIAVPVVPFAAGAWVALTVVVWTVGEMLNLPLVSAWVANRATDRNRGRYMGVMSIAFGSASALGPIAGTAIYERAGPDALWLSLAGLTVIVAAGYTLIARKVR